jgi:hypothetical protein
VGPICRDKHPIFYFVERYAVGSAEIGGGVVMVIGGCVKIIKTGGLGTGVGLIAIGGGIDLMTRGYTRIRGI